MRLKSVLASYTIATFDAAVQEEYTRNVAIAGGVLQEDVQLLIQPGSVIATSVITVNSAEDAEKVLSSLAISCFTTSNLGKCEYKTLAISTTEVATISPPPPTPNTGSDALPDGADTSDGLPDVPIGAIVGGAIGGLAVLAGLFALAYRHYNRKLERATHSNSPASLGSSLPTCEWQPTAGYACFLSHYKAECASTARLLHTYLQSMLGVDVFLDSSRLHDLRLLFDEGLHKSDVVVLLLTIDVLTRPWCLLELWEAQRSGIPVLPLLITPVHGQRGFDAAEAHAKLAALETTLDASALSVITTHLTAQQPPVPMSYFKEMVMSAIGFQSGVPAKDFAANASFLSWDPCNSDRLMFAATQTLCEKMALLSGRPPLRWSATHLQVHKPASSQASLPSRSLSTTLPMPSFRRNRCVQQADGFEIFISYHRAESGPDARVLHRVLEKTLNSNNRDRQLRAAFLDATDATDFGTILSALKTSRAIVLLLTRHVLERPWVLLEVFDAIRLGKVVVPVKIEGGGYDFATTKGFLSNLEKELGERDTLALDELRQRLADRRGPHVSVSQVGSLLARTIPNIIAVTFDPAGDDHGDHHLNAVAHEVVERAWSKIRSTRWSSEKNEISLAEDTTTTASTTTDDNTTTIDIDDASAKQPNEACLTP